MKTILMLSALGLMATAQDDSPPPGSAPDDKAADDKAADGKAAGKAAKKKVRCRVLINSLGEDDQTYPKGAEFTTSAERAAALGDSIEVLN